MVTKKNPNDVIRKYRNIRKVDVLWLFVHWTIIINCRKSELNSWWNMTYCGLGLSTNSVKILSLLHARVAIVNNYFNYYSYLEDKLSFYLGDFVLIPRSTLSIGSLKKFKWLNNIFKMLTRRSIMIWWWLFQRSFIKMDLT